MAGLPHIDKVKSHFISGEPGTTGREPFEHSSATGPGSNYTGGQGVTGAHTVGAGHTEQRGIDSLTSGSGLTSGSHAHNQTTGLGSTTGQQGQHGLTGEHDRSHFSNDKPTRHTNENEGLVDKAKAAVGLGGSGAASSTHGSNFANNPNHPNYAAADMDNRGVVDKINDVLPGTPAKHNNSSSHSHESTAAAGAGGAFGPGHTHADKAAGLHTGRDGDRVGSLGQSSANYEGSMGSGPRTGGAAGTDRFDSPSGGVGSGLNRHDDGVHHDTSQRAPGQSSGGIGGILGTSDKDFTGRERQGKGAYADTDGPFELNKSGPTGNTALTGREGNLDNNPVRDPNYAHNAHASVPAVGSGSTGTHGTTGTNTTGTHGHGHHNATATEAAKVGEATQPEHKSFLAKVKDAIL